MYLCSSCPPFLTSVFEHLNAGISALVMLGSEWRRGCGARRAARLWLAGPGILQKEVLTALRHHSFFHAHSARSVCAELLMGLLYLVNIFSPGCEVKPIKSLHSGTTARLTAHLADGELQIPTAV